MKHPFSKFAAVLTCLLLSAVTSLFARGTALAYEMPVDDSLLSSAQPLNMQPFAHSIQRYEMVPGAVDRRFTCLDPAASLKIIVEISHTNDIAHPATLQLVNPVGITEASFIVVASRLPRYPDVHLDSYKIRYGAELSTLVVNTRRSSKHEPPHTISGLLQSDGRLQTINCVDELIDPNSLLALDAPFEANLAEAKVPDEKLPKSVCSITAAAKNSSKFVCSAVLIAPNLALTANHCLAKLRGQAAQLNCGAGHVAQINIEESVSNPVHTREQWRVADDIALLKLHSQIALAPASLASTASEGADLLFTQTDSCGAFGYGIQFDGRNGVLHGVKFSPPPEDLGGLTLTLENYQNEKLITSDPRYFLRPGDSGGGVICNRGAEEVVVGIHSFSYPIDSTVHSASVGHSYQWLIQQIEKINGQLSPQANHPTTSSQSGVTSELNNYEETNDSQFDSSKDPNLINHSTPPDDSVFEPLPASITSEAGSAIL